MNVVSFGVSKTAVEEARNLLLRCESGETVAFTAIEEHPGGTYVTTGSATNSRTATAGMLLDAAIGRLGRDS